MGMALMRQQVKYRIAVVLERELGMPAHAVLAGTGFTEIDPDFDSLSLMETLLLLEREFAVEVDLPGGGCHGAPPGIDDLAELVMQGLMACPASFAMALPRQFAMTAAVGAAHE